MARSSGVKLWFERIRRQLLAFLALVLLDASSTRRFSDVARTFGIPALPLVEAVQLMLGLAVHLHEGKQLEQQVLAGLLEGGDRALEALEELHPDQPDNALLSLAARLEPAQCAFSLVFGSRSPMK